MVLELVFEDLDTTSRIGPRGTAELRIITGRGVHSTRGEAKLRPAVSTWLRKSGFSCRWELDGGVAVVDISSRSVS